MRTKSSPNAFIIVISIVLIAGVVIMAEIFSANARSPEKQCITPPHGNGPYSFSILSVSVCASLSWIITGNLSFFAISSFRVADNIFLHSDRIHVQFRQ